MDNPRRLMKMRSEDVVDRISKLPDNLQESILERLPIKDAVRTSILSCKWRYIWTVRKRLNFGEPFASLIPKFTAKKYVRIIHRILFLHHGPIEYVSLIIPKGVRADFIDLNSWLLILSRKGVQELEIDVFGYLETEVSLCSCLFQCHSLKFLKLSYFELKPPSDFCGFFSLVTLHLLHVTISSDLLTSLISKCKKLENLCLIGTSDCDWQDPKPLVINADNLRTLEYKDDDIRSIISKNLPHISAIPLGQFVNFSVPLPVVDPKLCRSFDPFISLIGIEKLDLDLPLVKPLDRECPDQLPVILVSLKSVKLYGVRICKREDIAFIFCLIRCAPYLETLHIELYQESSYSLPTVQSVVECLEVAGRKGNGLGKLISMRVGLSRNSYRWDYALMFELIRILLCNCPVLKSLYVAPDWEPEQREAMKLDWVMKLLKFRRLSSDAEIILC